MMGLISLWVGVVVRYHDALHSFRSGQGMWTTSLEAKPLQQLTITREGFLYEIFFDLQEAYYALDQ